MTVLQAIRLLFFCLSCLSCSFFCYLQRWFCIYFFSIVFVNFVSFIVTSPPFCRHFLILFDIFVIVYWWAGSDPTKAIPVWLCGYI